MSISPCSVFIMPSLHLELIQWIFCYGFFEHHIRLNLIQPVVFLFFFLPACHPHPPTPHHPFSVWNSQSWSNPEPAWSNVSLPVQWAAHSGWECCPVTVGIPVRCSVCVCVDHFSFCCCCCTLCASLWAFACDLWQLDSYPSVYVASHACLRRLSQFPSLRYLQGGLLCCPRLN